MNILEINAGNGTVNLDVAALLIDVAKAGVKSAKAQEVANEKRAGTYVTCVQAAILAGSGDDFAATIEDVMQDIRTGKIKVAAKPAKKPKGEIKFGVPGSLSTAKSVLLQAFKFGIDLIDAKGGPRKFTEIRDDGKAAKDLFERLADANVMSRFQLQELLDAIKAGALKMSGDVLVELVQNIQNARNWQIAQKPATKAATVAKALEDAAATEVTENAEALKVAATG